MNPIWGSIAGGFIVAMMIAFVGIWVWAWLPHHKRTHDDLARLPMEDGGTATEDRP